MDEEIFVQFFNKKVMDLQDRRWLKSDAEIYIATKIKRFENSPLTPSLVRHCSRCNEAVWVDEIRVVIADHTKEIVCGDCLTRKEKKAVRQYVLDLLTEALKQ